ncbi:hypothetical protein BT69DRAFT_1287440, partial [Atractiella rhizophila]
MAKLDNERCFRNESSRRDLTGSEGGKVRFAVWEIRDPSRDVQEYLKGSSSVYSALQYIPPSAPPEN